jgi:hypothetical protein
MACLLRERSLGNRMAMTEVSSPNLERESAGRGAEPVSPNSRNAPWARDELILALDLYVRFGGRLPGNASSEVKELSGLLNRVGGAADSTTGDFRNANGVYMKLMNFRRFDPVSLAQGKSGLTRGNKTRSGDLE